MSLLTIAIVNLVLAAAVFAGVVALMTGPLLRRRSPELAVLPARHGLDRAA